MIITVGQACAYVWSGIYGNFADLGFGNAALIVAQLTFAGIIVLLLVRS
jgi:protein transport protein SEC61 subunit alpha